MLFLCYPKCTTCQKARKWLDARGIPYTFRDIKESPPIYEELIQWRAQSGLPLRRFFNTSGQAYRALGLASRLPEMPDDDRLRLLATDGMLVKRPILIGEGFVLVGFHEAEWAAALEGARA